MDTCCRTAKEKRARNQQHATKSKDTAVRGGRTTNEFFIALYDHGNGGDQNKHYAKASNAGPSDKPTFKKKNIKLRSCVRTIIFPYHLNYMERNRNQKSL